MEVSIIIEQHNTPGLMIVEKEEVSEIKMQLAHPTLININTKGLDRLPIASAVTLGCVRIGSNLTCDVNGVLNGLPGGDGEGGVWGSIGGTITDQVDLMAYCAPINDPVFTTKITTPYAKIVHSTSPAELFFQGGQIDARSYYLRNKRTGVSNTGFELWDQTSGMAVMSVDGNGKLLANNDFDVAGNAYMQNDLGTTVFFSGFAGSGWKIEKDGGICTMTVDNLVVRQMLKAYELEIAEITSIGGSLIVSAANGTAYDVTLREDDNWNILFDEDNGNNPFQFIAGDFVRSQIFTGRGIDSFLGQVVWVYHNNTLGAAYMIVSPISGIPWKGMKLVQAGNSSDTDRQSIIYVTATDTGNPYIDGLAGVDDGVFAGKQKFRLGNLAGITDISFGGPLSGFGLYADNVYLKGKIIIADGSGYANLSDKPTSLSGINSTEGSKLTGIEEGATAGATWGTNLNSIPDRLADAPVGAGLCLTADHLGYYSGSAWKTYMDNQGNFILGDIAGGNTGIAWNQATGVLNIKGAINITSGSVPNSVVSGLGSLALKSAVDWSTGDISNIPSRFANAPVGAGLCITADYMGYYNGSAWQSYIDKDGNCVFRGDGEIAGWKLAADAIYTGTKKTSDGFSSSGITLASNGSLHAPSFYINADGKMGLTSIGSITMASITGAAMVIKGTEIYETLYNGDGGYGVLNINMKGYQGGTTRYRNLRIGDGKFNSVLEITGSTKTSTFYGDLIVYTRAKIGGSSFNSQAALDLSTGKRANGDPGALIVPCMTETQRDALTGVNGMLIYNTTRNQYNVYAPSRWFTLGAS